ncbi:MAG TPA: ThiF family adenylyltransferase [Fimbriimonas sp.]|nr:ThiF family adenylyltransferase [Fimbriimonas sp.]
MSDDFFGVPGDPVPPEDLRIPKARDLALRLKATQIQFATLVECRRAGDVELVVFDVDVEVPQVVVHQIHPSERISVGFSEADTRIPQVHALRKDFPEVPHLNLQAEEYPRSLCLYDQRYEELKRHWTSPRLVHRIREWLALTATGDLHRRDQPLEPLLVDFVGHLVLPNSVLNATSAPERLFVGGTGPDAMGRPFLVAKTSVPEGVKPNLIASVHRCSAQTHGTIRRRPTTFKELADLVSETGTDLTDELRHRLREWHGSDPTVLESHLLLVLVLPKRRDDAGAIETVETWAFYLGVPLPGSGDDLRIRKIGEELGVWVLQNGQVGRLLSFDATKAGEKVGLDVLNVSFHLTHLLAAALNGRPSPKDSKIVAVGLGALGSQVFMNLARAGFGRWTLVDNDHLMPHNVARHALDVRFLGRNKAEALALIANANLDGPEMASPLPVDVLLPRDRRDELVAAFQSTEVLLDMSASVGVARVLAADVESSAKRVSVFLTPSGRDLVLLAEDADRKHRLDALEMQYYRTVANDDRLSGHFDLVEGQQRFGQSCRDITSSLPQHLVGLHAATAARELRQVVTTPQPAIAVWRADDAGGIRRIDIAPRAGVRQKFGKWTVVTDDGLAEKLAALRNERLPNETGGVLLGSFDQERSIVYIVDALSSPPDSKEWPTLYIRGSKGLSDAVESVRRRTHEMLEYIGEWHSHPRGYSTAASSDDLQVFAWLTALMESDGLPAVMMIVGDPGRTSCYVGVVDAGESLLQIAGGST